METSFCVIINIRTVNGYKTLGRFSLGNNKEFAHQVFDNLKGEEVQSEKGVLYMDMVELKDGLPLNLKILSCSLEQLAQNVKMITKEVFRFYNLKEMP